MLNCSLSRIVSLITFTFFTTTIAYANLMTKQELDLVVKEDIAAAQVLNEICPQFVSDTRKINAQVSRFTAETLKDLSNPLMTLEQLKNDPEYQNAYKEALAENATLSKEEHKKGCETLLENDVV